MLALFTSKINEHVYYHGENSYWRRNKHFNYSEYIWMFWSWIGGFRNKRKVSKKERNEWNLKGLSLFLYPTAINTGIKERPLDDSTSLFLLFLSARLRKTLPGGDTTLMPSRARAHLMWGERQRLEPCSWWGKVSLGLDRRTSFWVDMRFSHKQRLRLD